MGLTGNINQPTQANGGMIAPALSIMQTSLCCRNKPVTFPCSLYCKMLISLSIFKAVPMGSSTLCLLLITVERYRSVVFPFHHQLLFTKRRRYALVGFSWFLAVLGMGIIPMTIAKPKSALTNMDMYAYSVR